MPPSSLPITSGDAEQPSTGSCCSSNKTTSFIITIALLALIGVAATHGGYHRSSIRPFPPSGKLIFPADGHRGRQLQRFGDDFADGFGNLEEEPVTTSSVVLLSAALTEEPVIHKVDNSDTPIVPGRAAGSSMPMGELINDEDAIDIGDIVPSASNEYSEIFAADSALLDDSENAVTFDSAAAARRRDAVVAKQDVFTSNEKVVIAFMNAINAEAGDWIAIVPASVGLGDDGMLGGNDYLAYGYVCRPGTDPLECPRYGSVAWDPLLLPPGEYMAYLAKEDSQGPFTVKAATSSPFIVGTGPTTRAESIEATSPTPVSPTPVQTGSLDTLWDGGIRNNGIMFMVKAKQDILITGFDIHTPLKELIPVTVYTTTGTLVGKEQDASQWKKIARATVMGAGDKKPTPVPAASTLISAGGMMAFYIDTPSVFIPGPLRYSPSSIPTGSVYADDSSISILVGTGNDAFFGPSHPNRIFNGAVHYKKL